MSFHFPDIHQKLMLVFVVMIAVIACAFVRNTHSDENVSEDKILDNSEWEADIGKRKESLLFG